MKNPTVITDRMRFKLELNTSSEERFPEMSPLGEVRKDVQGGLTK